MPTRRDLLKGACCIAALALGTVLLAEDANAADGIVLKPNGQVVLTVSKVPAFTKVGGVANLGTVKGTPVAIVRTGASTYKAVNLNCTHQGTTVLRSGAEWKCPSHGSQFKADGTFVSGPAGRSLNTAKSAMKSGKLTVG